VAASMKLRHRNREAHLRPRLSMNADF